jgi:hypothetical protein
LFHHKALGAQSELNRRGVPPKIKQKHMLKTPILFLIFKRPDVTMQVLSAIRRLQPSKLYVASDAARPDRSGEDEKVLQTRKLVLEGIDWPCEVETLFRETNLGCRMAVSSSIDWFFEHEEAGIILEDDCLPDPSFFGYCEELLERYRHDTRIMAISGDNFQQGRQRGNYSYYFSQLPHCWGWATWRRAWRTYHVALEHFEEVMAEPAYREFTHHTRFNQYRCKHIVDAYQKELDSWAFLWGFANHINHGLAILPQVNLVENIGFGPEATHTKGGSQKLQIKAQPIVLPLRHPPYVCHHKEADSFYFDTYLQLTPLTCISLLGKRLKDLFRKIVGMRFLC